MSARCLLWHTHQIIKISSSNDSKSYNLRSIQLSQPSHCLLQASLLHHNIRCTQRIVLTATHRHYRTSLRRRLRTHSWDPQQRLTRTQQASQANGINMGPSLAPQIPKQLTDTQVIGKAKKMRILSKLCSRISIPMFGLQILQHSHTRATWARMRILNQGTMLSGY